MMEERVKSTHRVEVVPIELEEHPNADALSIVRPWGYQVVVRTEDWKNVAMGAYIPPDSVVPDAPMFEFLGDHKRIKVRRFRGIFSQGMLVPAPEGSAIGDDVAEILGITRYEPPENLTMGGETVPPPEGFRPRYDVDAWNRYGELFVEGEEVIVTEKIHGANARFACVNEEMYCGSRGQWKKDTEGDLWWKTMRQNGWIEPFCRAHPELTIFGECWGQVQKLRYGTANNEFKFSVFDIWHNEKLEWVAWDDIQHNIDISDVVWVPILYEGAYSKELILELVDGRSVISGAEHLREGIVIQPRIERISDEIGRVKLKAVSDKYLEKD